MRINNNSQFYVTEDYYFIKFIVVLSSVLKWYYSFVGVCYLNICFPARALKFWVCPWDRAPLFCTWAWWIVVVFCHQLWSKNPTSIINHMNGLGVKVTALFLMYWFNYSVHIARFPNWEDHCEMYGEHCIKHTWPSPSSLIACDSGAR